MTTNENRSTGNDAGTPKSTTGDDTPPATPESLVPALDRAAAMCAALSTELSHFSAGLRGQVAGSTNHGSPPPGLELIRREPVDTSYVPPQETPVARAAGAPASGTRDRFRLGAFERITSGAALSGVVLLLGITAHRGWLAPVDWIFAGAGLGMGLIAMGVRLHRKSIEDGTYQLDRRARVELAHPGAFVTVALGLAILYLAVFVSASLQHGFLF